MSRATKERRVLTVLRLAPEPVTAWDLRSATGIGRERLHRTLDRLFHQGRIRIQGHQNFDYGLYSLVEDGS